MKKILSAAAASWALVIGLFSMLLCLTPDGAEAQVNKRLTITTASLPAVAAGADYAAVLTAGGGRPLFRWSIYSGNLPPGLSLAPGGTIGGVPTTQGNFAFTVRVQDSGRPVQSATRPLSIRINPPADRTVAVVYRSTVWTARLARGKLEVRGAGQGKWSRNWTLVGSNVYAFQGVGTSQGPVLIYASGNRWLITQLHWASGASQNRRSFGQRIFLVKGGQYGVTIRVGQACFDYSWNALKEIDCRTGRLIRVIR